MDPTACFQEFLLAISENEHDEAASLACSLSEWLGKGGFYPQGYEPALVNAAIAGFVKVML